MSLPPPALIGFATRVLGGPRCFARPRARSKLAARPRASWELAGVGVKGGITVREFIVNLKEIIHRPRAYVICA